MYIYTFCAFFIVKISPDALVFNSFPNPRLRYFFMFLHKILAYVKKKLYLCPRFSKLTKLWH